jgi:hypothetical protein
MKQYLYSSVICVPFKANMNYKTSFTGGGLLFNEMDALKPILMLNDWEALLNHEARENRLLKINSEASRKRVAQEVRLRMNHIDASFWAVYNEVLELDKKGLLFYVCLNTYKLIYDFHFKVTIPKYLSLETKVEPYWYEMRLQELSSSYSEVAGWTEHTKRKVITRYIDILRKTGLIEKGRLIKQTFSPTIYCFFLRKGESWTLDAFFLKQAEKESVINICNDN